MKRFLLIILVTALWASLGSAEDTNTALPTVPTSFSAAKRIALKSIYRNHLTTLYCSCEFTQSKVVNPTTCGYTPRNPGTRARRIEWEHIVPAARFGQSRSCWTEGHERCVRSNGRRFKGRRCCGKRGVDNVFRKMAADLHNLAPAIGELNADRSNFRYGEVAGEPRSYGACDFEIDRRARVAEPREGVRGDVARVYLYMADVYGLELDEGERSRLERWHQDDPPSDWEIERNRRIKEIQGVGNRWVEEKSE